MCFLVWSEGRYYDDMTLLWVKSGKRRDELFP